MDGHHLSKYLQGSQTGRYICLVFLARRKPQAEGKRSGNIRTSIRPQVAAGGAVLWSELETRARKPMYNL